MAAQASWFELLTNFPPISRSPYFVLQTDFLSSEKKWQGIQILEDLHRENGRVKQGTHGQQLPL